MKETLNTKLTPEGMAIFIQLFLKFNDRIDVDNLTGIQLEGYKNCCAIADECQEMWNKKESE